MNIDAQYIEDAHYAAKGLRLTNHHLAAEAIEKILAYVEAVEGPAARSAARSDGWKDEALADVLTLVGWEGRPVGPLSVGFALGMLRRRMGLMDAIDAAAENGRKKTWTPPGKPAPADARIDGTKAVADRFRDERDEARAELRRASAGAASIAAERDAATKQLTAALDELHKVKAERDLAIGANVVFCCSDHGWTVEDPAFYEKDHAARLHAIREYIKEMDESESTLDPEDAASEPSGGRSVATRVEFAQSGGRLDYVMLNSDETPGVAYFLVLPKGFIGRPRAGDAGTLVLVNGADISGGFRYCGPDGVTHSGLVEGAVKVG